jgi:hypothetical protein
MKRKNDIQLIEEAYTSIYKQYSHFSDEEVEILKSKNYTKFEKDVASTWDGEYQLQKVTDGEYILFGGSSGERDVKNLQNLPKYDNPPAKDEHEKVINTLDEFGITDPLVVDAVYNRLVSGNLEGALREIPEYPEGFDEIEAKRLLYILKLQSSYIKGNKNYQRYLEDPKKFHNPPGTERLNLNTEK